MTTLSWTSGFDAIVVADSMLLPNHYTITAVLSPNTRDIAEQNVSFDRLRTLTEIVLSSSIWVSAADLDRVEYLLSETDNEVVILPDRPFDQLIGVALYLKFRSVLEERFFIDAFSISSRAGDEIVYTYEPDLSEPPPAFSTELLPGVPCWWNRPDPIVLDVIGKDEDGNQVHVPGDLTWEMLDLHWEANKPKAGKVIKVVGDDDED